MRESQTKLHLRTGALPYMLSVAAKTLLVHRCSLFRVRAHRTLWKPAIMAKYIDIGANLTDDVFKGTYHGKPVGLCPQSGRVSVRVLSVESIPT